MLKRVSNRLFIRPFLAEPLESSCLTGTIDTLTNYILQIVDSFFKIL